MRAILDLCIRMDSHAERLYGELAGACPDDDLAATFRQLGRDEADHTGWWESLLDAWSQGLLPDVVNDTEALTERLESLEAELADFDASALAEMSNDEMLAFAARLEFFMIDPVFGELIDLMEPARAERRHAAYQAHLQRLIDAIGRHYPAGSLAGLLAQTLSRTWRDNLRLSVYATHDMLTGLHNRRALYTHLPQWAAWSARYGHPLAVLLIDVDYFKTVNDRVGHSGGDDALKRIAQALRQSVRASDQVMRYGGDEFAIIAPETDENEYRNLTDRILATVRELEMTDAEGSPVGLTVSIGGVVAEDPAGSAPRRVDTLLVAADQSLYAAKQSGRDQAAPPVITKPGV